MLLPEPDGLAVPVGVLRRTDGDGFAGELDLYPAFLTAPRTSFRSSALVMPASCSLKSVNSANAAGVLHVLYLRRHCIVLSSVSVGFEVLILTNIFPVIAMAFEVGTPLLVSILRNTGTDNFIESVAMSWDQVWQSQAQAGWCRCSREAQCYILWNLSMFKNALMVNLNVKLQAVGVCASASAVN